MSAPSPDDVLDRIAERLGVGLPLVRVADREGLLWALSAAELAAELRAFRDGGPGALSAPNGGLCEFVRAVGEVLGDRPWTVRDLLREAEESASAGRVAMALAVRALAGAAPGEDPSPTALGAQLARAVGAGPVNVATVGGVLRLQGLRPHRSGAKRYRVVETLDR